MKIGQYGERVEYMNGEIKSVQMVQLVEETEKEWRFKINSDDNYHLTLSKNVGFDHSWKVGEDGNIKMRSVIVVWGHATPGKINQTL